MLLICAFFGHSADSVHFRNQGLEFALCHHCGCDLIRDAEAEHWAELPRGYQLCWRPWQRGRDAAAVALRMTRLEMPVRHPRLGPPRQRRRGRPLTSMTLLLSMLPHVAELARAAEAERIKDGPRERIGHTIRLPARSA